jgi:hypothetical protein
MPSLKPPNAQQSSPWIDLRAEETFNDDYPLLHAPPESVIMVRLNQISQRDELISTQILAGYLERVSRDHGIFLRPIGFYDQDFICLPFAPDAFFFMTEGEYLLTNGMLIQNPYLGIAFDLYPPSIQA